MYSAGAQKRIMLIHDATQEIPASALRRALLVFALNPGDKLSLFGVFHQESKLKRLASTEGKITASQSFTEMELSKKKQYENSLEIMQVSKLCDTQEVLFSIEMSSGPSRKLLAVEAAKKSRATWVILDRKMKKDKNYFLRNLSCGISKMKQHNFIVQIRGPIIMNGNIHVEMASLTPICTEDVDDDDLFSIEISPAMSNEVTKHLKAKASLPARPLQKGILQQKLTYQEFTDPISVEDSIDFHQLQWLIRVMRSDPQRTLSMEKVILMLQHIFDYKTSNKDFPSLQSQKVSYAITASSDSISKKEGQNNSEVATTEVPTSNYTKQLSEVLASSPSRTRASNTSSEYEFISYTVAAPSHTLKREISSPKRQISYNEMICYP